MSHATDAQILRDLAEAATAVLLAGEEVPEFLLSSLPVPQMMDIMGW